jgi:hypothetical protein
VKLFPPFPPPFPSKPPVDTDDDVKLYPPPPPKPVIDDACYERCKILDDSSIITGLDMERLRAGDPILLSTGEVVDLLDDDGEGFTLPNKDVVKLNMTTGAMVRIDTDGVLMTDVEKGHLDSGDTSKSDSEKLCYYDCQESPSVRPLGFFGNETSAAPSATALLPLTIIMLALK